MHLLYCFCAPSPISISGFNCLYWNWQKATIWQVFMGEWPPMLGPFSVFFCSFLNSLLLSLLSDVLKVYLYVLGKFCPAFLSFSSGVWCRWTGCHDQRQSSPCSRVWVMALMSKCLLSADCQLESTSRNTVETTCVLSWFHSPFFRPPFTRVSTWNTDYLCFCPFPHLSVSTGHRVFSSLSPPSLPPSFSLYCTCFGMFGPTVCPRWSLFCACSSVTVLRTSLVKDSSACTFSAGLPFPSTLSELRTQCPAFL